MHPKDDMLRAFHDKELPASLAQPVREHLGRCPECMRRLEEISLLEREVRSKLDALAPGPQERPLQPQAAYARYFNNQRLFNKRKETFKNMFTRKTVWAALAVITVMALVFTITPASAWASSFLGLFRVQRVQVISFDPAAAENAKDAVNANQEEIKQIFKDELKIDRHGKSVKVASAEEAAQQAGFTPRIPAAFVDPVITVEPGMNAIFTINQPKLQALIDATGVEFKLPESTNGKTITADVPDAVAVSSGCPTAKREAVTEGSSCAVFTQMPSPTINAPEELNLPRIGEAVFRFLGLSPNEARNLSQRIDWTSTLVLPIPAGGDIQAQDVSVDGVSGTLIQENNGANSMIIWVKDGMLYGLRVPGGAEKALEAAASLK